MNKKPLPIRIVTADRQEMFREGLRRLLDMQPDFNVVADTGDGESLPALIAEHKPDVLLFDHKLRKRSGIEALRDIAALNPEVYPILLTDAIDGSELIQALIWGACGLVQKKSETELLFKSIRAVMAGDYWIGHKLICTLIENIQSLSNLVEQKTRQQSENLTRQQARIIEAIISGSSNKDIANDLSLSERTVKYHLTRIFAKFGVSSRMELARYSLKNKVLPGI